MKKIKLEKKTLIATSALCLLAAVVFVYSDSTKNVEFQIDRTPIERSASVAYSYAPIVKKVSPAIVSISTSKVIEVQSNPFGSINPFFDDNDLFRRFFGDRFPNQNNGNTAPQKKQKQTGLGSGVIVTKDGYILTNNHVVDEADEVKVSLDSGGEYTAKVVGKDSKSDIALLKIDADNLPVAVLGDSDAMETGDVVLAFGNPFGVGQTVTMGIISATGRSNLGIEEYENFIQTDAAINPGNSGGALTDAMGRVIGINTAIFSRSGGYQGIGFAIPVNMAENIMNQLVSHGKVTRGYLGIMFQPLTEELAESFGITDKKGAVVTEVTEDSAAEKAGLKSGDVIIEIDGKKIEDGTALRLMVADMPPGKTVKVKVVRGGKEQEFSVTLDERPDSLDGTVTNENGGTTDALKGVSVKPLTDEIRSSFQIPNKIEGLFVSEVNVESKAFDQGLRTGDVIIECNGQAVKNIADFKQALKNAVKGNQRLLVYSGKITRFVIIKE